MTQDAKSQIAVAVATAIFEVAKIIVIIVVNDRLTQQGKR